MFVMQLCKGTSTLKAELLWSFEVERIPSLGAAVERAAGDSVVAVTITVLIVPNCLLSCMDSWPDTGFSFTFFSH